MEHYKISLLKIYLQKTDTLEKQIPLLMNILNLMTINLATRHLYLSIAIIFFPIILLSSKRWVKLHTMIKWQLRWISRFNRYKFEVTSQIQISDKLQIIYHVCPQYYTVVFPDIKIIYYLSKFSWASCILFGNLNW